MPDTANVFAVPYTHDDPEKFAYIVEKCCDHRPWFDDWGWEDPEERKRIAIKYLSDAYTNGKLMEVWDGANIVGVLVLNKVQYRTDATVHFLFFDHELANKRQLCLNAMKWAFEHFDVHRLCVEIPTYARALASFARKKLGFRYEAEARQFSWPKDAKPLSRRQAELGSRRHQATRYKQEWHDVLLLSVTKEEFDDYGRSLPETRRAEDGGVREPVRSGELSSTIPTTDRPSSATTVASNDSAATVPPAESSNQSAPATDR